MLHSYSVSPSKKFENHQCNPFLASHLMKYMFSLWSFGIPLHKRKEPKLGAFVILLQGSNLNVITL